MNKKKNKLNEKTAGNLTAPMKILRFMASAILKKYNPRVIAVTGSIGKTSSKDAIFSVLKNRFRARKSEKNYNNEIGVPLTIFGTESGGKSLLKWFLIFLKWLSLMIFPAKYPEILILEMGADRPGDLKYLTDFVHPDIAVLTEVSSSHLEYFKNVEAILKEKATILRALDEKGLAIINADNPHIVKLKNNSKQNGITARIFSFGFSETSDARAMDVFLNCGEENVVASSGLSFKLNYKGATMPMRLNNILARHNIYAALAGVSVGIELGMNLVEIGAGLENFSLPDEDGMEK